VTGIPADQLPPEFLEKHGIKLPKSSGKDRREVDEPGLPVVCHYCQEPCDTDGKQAKHHAETGHARFVCLTA